MKKLIVISVMLMVMGSSYAMAENRGPSGKISYRNEYVNGNRYKGNIAPEDLPKPIKEYLKEHYPDHTIIVSKRQGNHKYFVKIRYGENQYRKYYRSLVFDNEGKPVKV